VPQDSYRYGRGVTDLWSRSYRLSLARLLECARVRLSSHATIPRTLRDPNIYQHGTVAPRRRRARSTRGLR